MAFHFRLAHHVVNDQIFVTSHYAGSEDLVVKFGAGEFLARYLNSVSDEAQALSLLDNAKYQV
ncbi:hypothetical protein RJ639_005683 [Escallonia herrerae]|uniref:Uncharacterized protein n=1 Tax=Escallonia herrerae TaxID=1293975 RepID=A0AA88VY74_9ASTE|nr:hypothetical protein RJ639_005683 [Escallonia herrerae]